MKASVPPMRRPQSSSNPHERLEKLSDWSEQPAREAMNAVRGGQSESETRSPADAAPAAQATPPAEVRAPAPAVAPVAPQAAAPAQSWQSAMPTIVPEVVHNTRIPVHVKERLMMLSRVPGETMKTILVRALEREMDRMEKELNAKSNKQG